MNQWSNKSVDTFIPLKISLFEPSTDEIIVERLQLAHFNFEVDENVESLTV